MGSWYAADAGQMRRLGVRLGGAVAAGHVLLLEGPLGAGKTTLVQGVADGMGLADPVTSPTFTLVHEYRRGPLPLYHLDTYRLAGPADVADLGFVEYLEAGGVVAVEWADRLGPLAPPDALWVRIEPEGEGRRVTLDATGPAHAELLVRLKESTC